MAKVSFFTVGCKLNQYETELIARQLEQRGFERVDWAEEADLYIVNSCNVTHKAAADSRRKLFGVKKQYPRARAVAIGCYADLHKDELDDLNQIDLVISNDHKDHIISRLAQLFPEIEADQVSLDEVILDRMNGRSRALVNVQTGCNQGCSYCIIPKARGTEKSRSVENVVGEIKALEASGYREVILTGVHVGRYAEDATKLSGLLYNLLERTAIERIRLSSLEVNEINHELIDITANSGRICRHFHVPLQSGSDKILRMMNRPYKLDFYRHKIEKIKERIPGVMIGADVIVGFPGEGENEFRETLELIENSPIDYLHVFSYSDHPEARSFTFEDKLTPPEIKSRNRILTEIGDLKWKSFLQKQMSEKLKVLFESRYCNETGTLTGLSDNYIRVKTEASSKHCNQIRDVEPESIVGRHMIGRVITQ
jgi:threonylcarbamoyladenosine tRNA methylthiotransferase MtaB